MAKVVKFEDPGKRRTPSFRSDSRERKVFMSSRASDVLKEVGAKRRASEEKDDEFGFDFDSIFRGVENFGNSQLPWKERKRLEQKKLEAAAGAKPLKKPRRAPELGLRTKRKRESKEELQRQEDIAAGNYVKPVKKRKERSGGKGLRASEGKFKNGVLYVKPLEQDQKRKDGKHKKGRRK